MQSTQVQHTPSSKNSLQSATVQVRGQHYENEGAESAMENAEQFQTHPWAGALPVTFSAAPISRIQTKLTVGAPDDAYEREADAVAERVMQMGEAPLHQMNATMPHKQSPAGVPHLQRAAAHESPREEDGIVVGKEDAATPVQRLGKVQNPSREPLVSQASLQRRASMGTPLAEDLGAWMGSRMSADFSGVRIHHDGEAAGFADAIQARAFTHGRDIYFNHGEYQPATAGGKRLLAHELTHVIQQGAAKSGTAATPSPATPAIQRMGPIGPVTVTGKAPWRQSPYIRGDDHTATTDGGSTVAVWKAYSPLQYQYHYWCHGHSLGTFYDFGYSVYSGSPMATVIRDEWTPVQPANTQAGDIAVWTNDWGHSAKFITPVISNGTLDTRASLLSSKNGQDAVADLSIDQIATTYGNAGIRVYRQR